VTKSKNHEYVKEEGKLKNISVREAENIASKLS